MFSIAEGTVLKSIALVHRQIMDGWYDFQGSASFIVSFGTTQYSGRIELSECVREFKESVLKNYLDDFAKF
jgi:hypothetical protein